jgi:hypothetical protein
LTESRPAAAGANLASGLLAAVEEPARFEGVGVCISFLIMLYQLFFSLSTINTSVAVCITLQHLAHSHIKYVSLLSFSQHYYSRFNNFRIHFMDKEFEKIIR